jgi:hypothetical protein
MPSAGNKEPWRVDRASGEAMPLFVPPAMLDDARRVWPKLWIEPTPDIPLVGRAITYADWRQALA